MRVAWQSGYDSLALHLQLEEKLKIRQLRASLAWLDGAYFPFSLPGFQQGESFLFADTVGLAGVLMVSADDPEPKAAAALMATCYTGDSSRLAPSLGKDAGDALAREIARYLDTHTDSQQLLVHAVRPGDGMTVVRALGAALKNRRGKTRRLRRARNCAMWWSGWTFIRRRSKRASPGGI